MKVLLRKQMQEVDKEAIEKLQIPSLILMENAALAVVEVIHNNYLEVARKGVIVVCGSGNNGGDGMAIARHLFLRNIPVKVFLSSKLNKLKSDSLTQFNILKNLKIPVFYIEDVENEEDEQENFIQKLTIELGFNPLVIDALVGIGVKSDLGKFYNKIIQTINKFANIVISVDVPSGLDVDTGKFFASEPVRASTTVTFAYPKLGFFLYPSYLYVGKLVVANISIPYTDRKDSPNIHVVLPFEVADTIQYFPPNYYKNKIGNVLIIGGSYRYTGAPVLASRAAFKSNAGMVYLMVDRSIHEIISSKTTEEIVEFYDKNNYEDLLNSYYQKVQVVLFGNGIEDNQLNYNILKHVILNFKGVLVVDGTGIHMFYDYFIKNKNDFKNNLRRIILTPHPGELSSFFTKVSSKVKASVADDIDRLNNSIRLASFIPNSIIVSKGNPTFTCFYTNNLDNVYLNITNGISLAKAGSGDVLAGMISAFVANSFFTINRTHEDMIIEAVKNAVFLHGLAGQIARKNNTSLSNTPSDILENIPKAIDYILQNYSRNISISNLNSFSKSIIEYLQILDV
ncbi:MAG: NAD(P)H-hydrate epimerase [Candidatus Calescibacterium sp.]|nr:NAD(P)H-hydrate epimerase [Candidatus Calescibacterium sp.]MCX7972020.1 NAD(P)H-hydrate epimerase [bacterium]MDW8194696.1 NAD(P)H-hydrate epimerase [Candidatus Calescibacterium sp.]